MMAKTKPPPKTLPAGIGKVLKRLHYQLDVILTCVRWYVAYTLSLRNLAEMMAERGIEVDHSSVHRWRRIVLNATQPVVAQGRAVARIFNSCEPPHPALRLHRGFPDVESPSRRNTSIVCNDLCKRRFKSVSQLRSRRTG
jgi:hypothetical protein